ncbi:MAG: hypothetical protein RR854_07410 [Muribaculaceae bacterium]
MMEISVAQANKTLPTFWQYVNDNNDKFGKRIDRRKQRLSLIFVIISMALIASSQWLTYLPNWLMLGIGAIGILYFGFEAINGGESYYNKQSGGSIKSLGNFNFFNSRSINVQQRLVQAFRESDYDYLIEAPTAHNQPMQMHIFEDKEGRELYIQLMIFGSQFKPITEVITLCDDDFDEYEKLFKMKLAENK